MYKKLALVVFALSLFAGCASVPMETTAKNDAAKKFTPPSNGKAGLYIYRSGSFGGALKKDVWLDGKCIGETAPNVFFYEEVTGNVKHQISTESEFSPNDLEITTAPHKNYFIRQYIKFGAFVGGAGLELIGEEDGKKAVSELQLAKKGTCSK